MHTTHLQYIVYTLFARIRALVMHAVVQHRVHIWVSAAADFTQAPGPHILVDRLPCPGNLRPLMIAQVPGRPVSANCVSSER